MAKMLNEIVDFGKDTAIATLIPIEKRVERDGRNKDEIDKAFDKYARGIGQIGAGASEAVGAIVVGMVLDNYDLTTAILTSQFLAIDGVSRMYSSNGILGRAH